MTRSGWTLVMRGFSLGCGRFRPPHSPSAAKTTTTSTGAETFAPRYPAVARRCAACRCGRSARTSRAARTPTATRSASATSTWRRTRRGGARRTVRRTSGVSPTWPGHTASLVVPPTPPEPAGLDDGIAAAVLDEAEDDPQRRPAARSAPRSKPSRRRRRRRSPALFDAAVLRAVEALTGDYSYGRRAITTAPLVEFSLCLRSPPTRCVLSRPDLVGLV